MLETHAKSGLKQLLPSTFQAKICVPDSRSGAHRSLGAVSNAAPFRDRRALENFRKEREKPRRRPEFFEDRPPAGRCAQMSTNTNILPTQARPQPSLRGKFNDYEIRGDHAVVILTRRDGTRLETLVDLDVLQEMAKHGGRWSAQFAKNINQFYAIYGVREGGRHRPYLLHRFVMNARGHEIVDHINHNTLDNRRKNLRIGSATLNALNRSDQDAGIVPLPDGRWRIVMNFRGESYSLETVESKAEARLIVRGARLLAIAMELKSEGVERSGRNILRLVDRFRGSAPDGATAGSLPLPAPVASRGKRQ